MEWIKIISLFLANGVLVAYFRAESRAYWRQMDQKTVDFIREMKEMKERRK